MSEPQSMGDYLRATRRRRRISIERAAQDTKIRSDFLMRMESDEWDFLAPAYVRGFLRTYAQYLRVDPAPLLKELTRRHGVGIETARMIAQEGRRSNSRSMREPRKVNSWMIASVAAVFIIVMLGVVGLTQPDEGDDGPVAGVAVTSPPATEGSPEGDQEATSEDDGEEDEEQEQEDVSGEIIAQGETFQVEIVATRGRCWIEVTADDTVETADGGVILEVGDEIGPFFADESMTIVFGFAEGVDLIVNGRNLGPPGGPGATTITLPDDVENF